MRQSLRLLYIALVPLLQITVQAMAQNPKEVDFKNACNKLLESFSKTDRSGVNSLIDSKQGVYVLFRTGALDEYANLKKMVDDSPLKFENFDIIEADLKKYRLQYGKLPLYDCGKSQDGKDGWNKRGFFTDSVKKYTPVSTVVAFRVKYGEEKSNKKNLVAIRSMELNSRKVVFTGKAGEGIIFYLIYLKGKWWLSVIDRVTTDCSA